MTEAIFRSAGFAFTIKVNPDQKKKSKLKPFAPEAFGTSFFSPAQLEVSIQSKKFFVNLQHHSRVWINFVGTNENNNRPDSWLIKCDVQTRPIPTSLWRASDFVLQFNFKVANTSGSVNIAADFLSRLELKVAEWIGLKIRENIQTTPIEVTTPSSDVTDEN